MESSEAAIKHNVQRTSSWTLGLGVAPLLFLLPPLVYYMWIAVVRFDGALIVPTPNVLRSIPTPTLSSMMIYGGWFLFQAALQRYAPGAWVEGTQLSNGTRLKYKMNGWFSWWFTWLCLGVGVGFGWIKLSVLYDEFGPLLTTVNIFSFLLCIYLYIHGKKHPDDGHRGLTGNVIYDYFMGTSLNPRVGIFDWKLFCEARPGLIAWVILNFSFAAKQYELHGRVSTPMIFVCLFQFWYIADYYFHEEAILTTWDIKHENFGWMLCWGCLVWVPFTYTLQALYLVNHAHELPIWALVAIVILNTAGYIIFRGTNIQKHRFRKDPAQKIWGKSPEFIQTATGAPLLVSGFWGWARHLNYLGDLMMGLAWCLLTGLEHFLPYFYIIYFTILLIHRERRDHAACEQKYGNDWTAYCKRVRWRILPGVY